MPQRSSTIIDLATENPKLLALFQRLDHKGDGKLDAEDVTKMLSVIGLSAGSEAVLEAISQADADADGQIEFDEFVVIMRRAEEIKAEGFVAWDELWEQRRKVLAWVSFPATMVVATFGGAIFSLRYVENVGDAVKVVNSIYDIAWKLTGGVGASDCPETFPECSYTDMKDGKHWPVAAYLATHYFQDWQFLLVHVVTVCIAFMIFPFQFWKGLRAWSVEKGNGLHKWMGRTALTLLIFIAMPTSLGIAGGPGYKTDLISRLGFYAMAAAVTICGTLGWYNARKKKFKEHQKWMTRCFGSMLGGFFAFRIALSFLTWIPMEVLWPMMCWGSWIVGLIMAEVYLRRTRTNEQKYLEVISAGRSGSYAKSLKFHKDQA